MAQGERLGGDWDREKPVSKRVERGCWIVCGGFHEKRTLRCVV
uniref:Uncharacterized protein n=1 Tax=Brassica oleracea TaxID=3712 RepID=A0A3P6C0C3_BRAOL|nr:unnamed protein product [Brassica oleracea]